jgi:putative nucleotidyltransferase-like protein
LAASSRGPSARAPATGDREREFLLRALRGEARHGQDADADAELDWPRLLCIAKPFLHPFLLHCLDGAGYPIPGEIRGTLAQAQLRSTVQYLRRKAELERIVIAAQERRLRLTVLKGMVLAHTIYPRPELRPMADIDLLVRPCELAPMSTALESLGWQVEPWSQSAGDHADEGSVAFCRPQSTLTVDLHALLEITQQPVGLDLERVLGRTRSSTVGRVSVVALGEVDTLMQLCAHLSINHRFAGGLRWILDIHRFISHSHLDWDQLCREAAGARTAWLYAPLLLSRELFHTAIPEAVLAPVEALDDVAEVVALAREQLWANRRAPWAWLFTAASVRQALVRALRQGNPWRSRTRLGEIVWQAPRSLHELEAACTRAVGQWSSVKRLIAAWRNGYFQHDRFGRTLALERDRERLRTLLIPSERSRDESRR